MYSWIKHGSLNSNDCSIRVCCTAHNLLSSATPETDVLSISSEVDPINFFCFPREVQVFPVLMGIKERREKLVMLGQWVLLVPPSKVHRPHCYHLIKGCSITR